ncbi:hypothetical protein WALSEDRAFT_67974 [Wallemia mellicola CBS 633.66]|uniref:Uncharacterized protein n=1 Tax=Wallemia mellicola (strain ATCC MYA-4683 / CBS 633.66) TaxID=671144 RepID=I4YGM1_WALMC|nr:hypothetical protein WALSEDRAFT_67974 [Wallemia mellicola CBS 633.66]EIM23113.1 hypothetical protein WALSEDRAFT_67974 [Wallemia mellicola CBS 633.66]|eukprot:XP_006957146.1 hypothetical protein WALSEDRAFT_67974 [Wallemia mellicola CBS 633.66]
MKTFLLVFLVFSLNCARSFQGDTRTFSTDASSGESFGGSLTKIDSQEVGGYKSTDHRDDAKSGGKFYDIQDAEGNTVSSVFYKVTQPVSKRSNFNESKPYQSEDVNDVTECVVGQLCYGGDKVVTTLKNGAYNIAMSAYNQFLEVNNNANYLHILGGAVVDFSVQVGSGQVNNWLNVRHQVHKTPSSHQDACINQNEIKQGQEAQTELLREILKVLQDRGGIEEQDQKQTMVGDYRQAHKLADEPTEHNDANC